MRTIMQQPKITPTPTVVETLSVFVGTVVISIVTALLAQPYIPRGHAILVSYASHVPQLMIPWAWYMLRVAPVLPREQRSLWTWPAGTLRPLVRIAMWMVGLKLLGTFVEAAVTPRPAWVSSGFLTVMLILLYQGVFVGISEEMMVRPALHQPLRLIRPGGFAIGRLHLSWAWLATSLLFGLFHMPNALLGQSVPETVVQVFLAAIVGGIIGYYYERTRNYLGTAVLHGLFDLASYLPFLLVSGG